MRVVVNDANSAGSVGYRIARLLHTIGETRRSGHRQIDRFGLETGCIRRALDNHDLLAAVRDSHRPTTG